VFDGTLVDVVLAVVGAVVVELVELVVWLVDVVLAAVGAVVVELVVSLGCVVVVVLLIAVVVVEPVLAVVVFGCVVAVGTVVGTGLQSNGFSSDVDILRRYRSPVPKSDRALG
jgi:hypothetical protein